MMGALKEEKNINSLSYFAGSSGSECEKPSAVQNVATEHRKRMNDMFSGWQKALFTLKARETYKGMQSAQIVVPDGTYCH